MIYLLTAIGLTPGGSSTVHIYTRTVHRTTQNKQYIEQQTNKPTTWYGVLPEKIERPQLILRNVIFNV